MQSISRRFFLSTSASFLATTSLGLPLMAGSAPSPVVSLDKAKEILDHFNQKSCTLRLVWDNGENADCIPFGFALDSVCINRAHIMCQIMREHFQVEPGKIWNIIFMEDNPDHRILLQHEQYEECNLGWGFHVAPTLQLNDNTKIILDPSIKNELLTPGQWKQATQDANLSSDVSRIVHTSWKEYNVKPGTYHQTMPDFEFDPDFSKATANMATSKKYIRKTMDIERRYRANLTSTTDPCYEKLIPANFFD